MKRLKAYFSFENETYLEGGEVFDVLTETSILEAEEYLSKQKVDVSNIYFKLLSQIQFLEKDVEKNRDEIAYLYHLIGYYVGLFLHPFDGDKIAINYIHKAISMEKNSKKIEQYQETIQMIQKEL